MKEDSLDSPPELRQQVHDAIDSVFDCDENSSLEQRFDAILQVMISNAFFLLDRQRRSGVKPSDEEKDFQQECLAQLKLIEKGFSVARKNGRIGNVPNQNFEGELLVRIKKMRGSMGNIVTTLK